MPSTRPCRECGAPVELRITRDLTRKFYCSRVCRSRYIGRQRDMSYLVASGNTPEANARKGRPQPTRIPVGGKTLTSHGYVKVKMPGETWQYEHRLVAGAPEGMDVHHLDGDRTNNDPLNLTIMSHAEHRRLHAVEEYPNGPLSQR